MALVFDVQQASGKPDDNRRPGTACPFCNTEGLTNIIQRDGDCIWLENKFKTLRATRQTVLIESADHDADLVTYEPDELHHVMRFALDCWQQMIDSQQYRSVLMYKNKGPLSGGSLVHPHMQIVGLEQEDGYAALTSANFEGIDVWQRGRVAVNISTEPIMGFFEVNVSAPQGIAASDGARDQAETDLFADAIQVALRYILNEHHGGRAESYNLFFYHLGGRTIAKALPRWVVSSYFVGYRLAQVNAETTLDIDAERLRAHLETLEKNGYIRRDPTKPRAIEICDDSFQLVRNEMTSIPIIGTVAAGQPILAAENIEGYFPVPVDMVPNAETFILKVKGDSMINAGIFSGDQIFVERTNVARNGDMVVALVDDSATVKTFYKEQGHVRLQPENDTMDPIIVDDCDILGKVFGVFRLYR